MLRILDVHALVTVSRRLIHRPTEMSTRYFLPILDPVSRLAMLVHSATRNVGQTTGAFIKGLCVRQSGGHPLVAFLGIVGLLQWLLFL